MNWKDKLPRLVRWQGRDILAELGEGVRDVNDPGVKHTLTRDGVHLFYSTGKSTEENEKGEGVKREEYKCAMCPVCGYTVVWRDGSKAPRLKCNYHRELSVPLGETVMVRMVPATDEAGWEGNKKQETMGNSREDSLRPHEHLPIPGIYTELLTEVREIIREELAATAKGTRT